MFACSVFKRNPHPCCRDRRGYLAIPAIAGFRQVGAAKDEPDGFFVDIDQDFGVEDASGR